MTDCTAGDSQVRLLRPLLGVHKTHLEQYCTEAGLEWIKDPTNRITTFVRNLLRHHLADSPSAAAQLSNGGEPSMEVGTAYPAQAADTTHQVTQHAAASDGDIRADILRLMSSCREVHRALDERAEELWQAATGRTMPGWQRGVLIVGQHHKPPAYTEVDLRVFTAADQSTGIRALSKLIQVPCSVQYTLSLAIQGMFHHFEAVLRISSTALLLLEAA